MGEWAKKELDVRAKDVVMTSKLENQPGMVTTWNLGVVRNFLRQQRGMDPDNKKWMEEEEMAKMCEPTLQLSKTHAVVKKMSALAESDPELASLVLNHIYSTAMVNAGIQEGAIALASKSSELLEKLLEKVDSNPAESEPKIILE